MQLLLQGLTASLVLLGPCLLLAIITAVALRVILVMNRDFLHCLIIPF